MEEYREGPTLEFFGRAAALDDGEERAEEFLVSADAGVVGKGTAGVGEGVEGGLGLQGWGVS